MKKILGINFFNIACTECETDLIIQLVNNYLIFRRTADVRSVGYSELFSLSREDVLAAMKDYPEAQDILQTLGRKRLQEVKSMSRQKVKGKGNVKHKIVNVMANEDMPELNAL